MKIGVFDSGLGGLTVVVAMTEMIKGAEIFYVADTKHAPYGEKTKEEILQFSLDITQYLIDHHHIEALIVACNTATSAAIKELREAYPGLIIIGTEPGIKPAIQATKTKNIGVLATPATLKGDKYQQLVTTLASDGDIKLYEQACPGLVEQIEKGEIQSSRTREMLAAWLEPMLSNNVDTIVLGCTHYPLVADLIQEIMVYDIVLIHTGYAISRHLLAQTQNKGHLNEGPLKIHLYTTGEIQTGIIDQILPGHESVKSIKI
ncbi:MAG: glutamate racemase [Campylobacterales bacterium]|nr:glutamate racemase [Campylobacterales bacterium]